MKKKIIAQLLLAVMLVTQLNGCGGKTKVYQATLPTQEEEAEIYVQKIDGLASDFIKGMDVSSVISEEAAGVKYYDEDGKEQDVFQILADSGVNYARIRIWNNPYDEDGNGYGGGNNDLKTGIELGKRATKYGMKTCVDFHYSDFWADPNKQMAPKEWADMSLEEKTDAISEYTYDSLEEFADAGVDVGMVQIGNEINYGLAGESDFDNELQLLVSAAKAVHQLEEDKNLDIQVVVHFTEVDNAEATLERASRLQEAGVDYDIFGISYYTFWHGTYENMISTLSEIKETYGVETCIMETSYLFTREDADGSANSISEADVLENYPATVQGQANNLRDVMAAASQAGALGVFYWEGCWIAASDDYAANKALYEETGCGWASSYAGEYDPNDAGKYYGGCSWDNQAFFDATGKKLASLDVFKYVNYGAKGKELEIINVPDLYIEVPKGEELSLATEIPAIYNDTSCEDLVAVEWNADELKSVDTDVAGVYTVSGTAAEGQDVVATIKVISENLLINGGFEDADTSVWVVTSQTGEDPTDIQTKEMDAHTDANSFHWWSESAMDYDMAQTVTVAADGTYSALAYIQGGDVGSDALIYLFVRVTDANGEMTEYQSDPITLTGWVNWENPIINNIEVTAGSTVEVGMHVTCDAGGWGTMDDFELVQ
ncbi:MAG: glycosyl hydrolase family 53 [Lachnospiraceae bacterium]|nr:glycosyl hydrolase family 53 [Lachnospiraceae bacterium]